MTKRVSIPLQPFGKSCIRAQSVVFALLALAWPAFPLFAQTTAPAQANPAAKAPAFDVVSIRPHKDNGNYSHWGHPTADGFQAYNYQVFDLIFSAYELKCSAQLIGLPKWGYEDSFDIDARLGEAPPAAFRQPSVREQLAYAAPMIRSTLADRFRLKVHPETRVLPVYDLVIAKGGFKLKQAQGAENLLGMNTNRGLIHIPRGPIGARFIVGLSNETGRIVVDKTGLTGYYDIDLKWTPDEDIAAGVSGPTLFTALEEQLGLKLVPAKAPVDVLVVDHVERPTAN